MKKQSSYYKPPEQLTYLAPKHLYHNFSSCTAIIFQMYKDIKVGEEGTLDQGTQVGEETSGTCGVHKDLIQIERSV